MSTESQHVLQRITTLLRVEKRKLATQSGLSVAQLESLHYLALCNRYSDTPAGVADFLGATKGTVSESLAALEAKGLLTKAPDDDDGRLSHCRLTETGRAIVKSSSSAAISPVELPTDGLVKLLRRLQVVNERRSFGVCRTCTLFEKVGKRARCGFTGEPLSVEDSTKLCREHQPHASD